MIITIYQTTKLILSTSKVFITLIRERLPKDFFLIFINILVDIYLNFINFIYSIIYDSMVVLLKYLVIITYMLILGEVYLIKKYFYYIYLINHIKNENI